MISPKEHARPEIRTRAALRRSESVYARPVRTAVPHSTTAIVLLLLVAACGEDSSESGLFAVPADEIDSGPLDGVIDFGGSADAGADASVPAVEADAAPPDESGGEPPQTCACIEDAKRFCDQPAYCAWGVQACEVRQGVHVWGICWETYIPRGCEPGGENARPYDWTYRGGAWDGRVDDPDGDGVVTSEPDWWLNPAGQDCAIREGRCVQDVWDLDLDGDTGESMGTCSDVEECV